MENINAIINRDSIGLYVGGSLTTIKSDHPYFEDIKEAIKENDISKVESLVDKKKIINEYGNGLIRVEGGQIFYKDRLLSNHLTNRVSQLMREGFAVENLVKFIENLYENPSNRAVEELYTFLERFSLPITTDGCFLAYKAITNDHKDLYTRQIDNSIGCSPEMERNLINENKDVACAAGLHVGAIGYVKSYGGVTQKPVNEHGNRVMIVKVNPRDAVSVPSDHNCAKLRTCKYTVVAELADYNKVLENAVYTSDAEETEVDDVRFKVKAQKVESNDEYLQARTDGELDASSGVRFQTPVGKSSKYIRGYKNGYKRSGVNIK